MRTTTRGVLQDAGKGTPSAVAAGVGRAVADNTVNPGLAGVPLDKRAWAVDGATVGLGLLGLVVSAVTGDDAYYQWTEGALQAGIAYASQDGTHEIMRQINKTAAGTTVPKTVMQVVPAQVQQVRQVQQVAAGGGGMFAGV